MLQLYTCNAHTMLSVENKYCHKNDCICAYAHPASVLAGPHTAMSCYTWTKSMFSLISTLFFVNTCKNRLCMYIVLKYICNDKNDGLRESCNHVWFLRASFQTSLITPFHVAAPALLCTGYCSYWLPSVRNELAMPACMMHHKFSWGCYLTSSSNSITLFADILS